jgi:hypothetical protein
MPFENLCNRNTQRLQVLTGRWLIARSAIPYGNYPSSESMAS